MNERSKRFIVNFLQVVLVGTFVGSLPSAYQVVSSLSQMSTFSRVRVGMQESEAAELLTNHDISCDVRLLLSEHKCRFSDFWRDYAIVADPTTGTISSTSYQRRRHKLIVDRILK